MFDFKKAGEKIAILRKEKGMTQEELAEKMGVSSQAVSKWENGKAMPEVSLLVLLSETLDCSVDTILHSDEFRVNKPNYIHMLLPYTDVAPYTGSYWPRSMAFPAMMTALKLFMGLEERRNYNNHQINDDQEYILQSGISTQAFGFSYYHKEFLHDCFNIYGLDYKCITLSNKSFDEITNIIRTQIRNGYPVILQNKEYNANFLFITGFIANGEILKAHEFMEGFDEKNCNMNPYEMKNIDNWLKPSMEIILFENTDKKISIEEACKNALNNYCSMMSGILNKDVFIGSTTSESFKRFMGYGSDIYSKWIEFLKQEENKNIDSLNNFSPQDCILYESNYRTMGFLSMCKEYIKDIDKQYLNAAIDKYNTLCGHSHDILDVVGGRLLSDKSVSEKRQIIINCLIRSNEILKDAIYDIKKAIDFDNK